MASKKLKQEEALKFLDDLDSFAPSPDVAGTDTNPKPPPAGGSANEGEAAEVFAFLDEITQKSTEPTRTSTHISRSGTPTLRKSTERVRLGGGSPFNPSASSSTTSLNRTLSTDSQRGKESAELQAAAGQSQGVSGGGWGWGSVWSSASAAIQQAKSAVDEQVKHLPKNEQARKWGEGVIEYAKTAQLDKLSV